MRKLLTLILLLGLGLSLSAQQAQPVGRLEGQPVKPAKKVSDELFLADVNALTDEQLDTIDVKKKLVINDYTMFGVQYGAGLSQVMWNPTQKQEMVFIPYNVGIMGDLLDELENNGLYF